MQEPQHAHQHRDQTGETEVNPWEGDTEHIPQEAGVWGEINTGPQESPEENVTPGTAMCPVKPKARTSTQRTESEPFSKGEWRETFL